MISRKFRGRRTGAGSVSAAPIRSLPPVAGVQTSMEADPDSNHGVLVVPTSSYFAIEVENTGLAVQEVILFDAGGMYQFDTDKVNHADLTIRGITKNYQALLNRLSRYDLQVHKLHMEIVAGEISQFDNTIRVFKSQAGDADPQPWQHFYPSQGRHSGQYQLKLVELNPFNVILEHSTAMVQNIEPGAKVVYRFFITREFGRTH